MTDSVTAPLYLDHNATTPLDPDVIEAMEPYLRSIFANPSSIEHEHGHVAARGVEHAREQVADAIGARSNEIIFTGSCTEANNLAIIGTAHANSGKKHIITSRIEHPAVLEPIRHLEQQGWHATYLDVDDMGRVAPADVEAAISDQTLLVSIMAANNEVGTIQPIREIGAICAHRGVFFHSDLAQILAYGTIDVLKDGLHLASISAHKAYGPKGIGGLYVRSRSPRVKISPIQFGGGQERGLRSGTLNPAGIVGMGAALEIARKRRNADAKRLSGMCTKFRDTIASKLENVGFNGDPENRLTANLNFSIAGVEPLALIRSLRSQISFSASSACATDKIKTSHVLLAMFGDIPRAREAFRISPGRFTEEDAFELSAKVLIEAAYRLRKVAA
jgi:cysteine desulfurase